MALAVGAMMSVMAPGATYRCGSDRTMAALRLSSSSSKTSVRPSDWPDCISPSDRTTLPAWLPGAFALLRISKSAPLELALETSTVSSNVIVNIPVPSSRAADSTVGGSSSAVSAISALLVEAARVCCERSTTAPEPKYTYGVACPMAASLTASRSFIVISESVSTVEVTADKSPETLRAVPPLAAVAPAMKIFSRSTSAPSFTDSSNVSVNIPVPSSKAGPSGAAVTSVGAVVSSVSVISAATVDAAMSWSDRSFTAPEVKYTYGVACPMASFLATSRSFIVISESVSTVEVTADKSPVTLRAVPPLAAVLPVMKIFSRSTSEPSFTDSLNFSVSTPVPSSRAGPFGAAVTSVGAVVSAVRVNW